MLAKPIARGLLTYVPGLLDLVSKRTQGSTKSPLYCYEVWMKHLCLVTASGMQGIPASVGEIGPGDSIGVGIAALLCGANHYFSLDVVRCANTERNLEVLDGIVALLRARTPRPEKGWPDYDHLLNDKLFPGAILTDALLNRTLDKDRVAAIRAAIREPGKVVDGISVQYVVPWTGADINRGSVDLVFSQSCLEHVTDLDTTYDALNAWLSPTGWMSHQIDYSAHGVVPIWNGCWTASDPLWKIIVGTRPFLINRAPHSTHVKHIERIGFDIKCNLPRPGVGGIDRSQLAAEWTNMSDEDFNTMGAYIAATRRRS